MAVQVILPTQSRGSSHTHGLSRAEVGLRLPDDIAQIKRMTFEPKSRVFITRGRFYPEATRWYVVASGSGVLQEYEVNSVGHPISGVQAEAFYEGCVIEVAPNTCYRFIIDDPLTLIGISAVSERSVKPLRTVFTPYPTTEVRATMIKLMRGM